MDMEAAYARWQKGGPLRPTPSGAEEATTLMGGHEGEYVVLSSEFGPWPFDPPLESR